MPARSGPALPPPADDPFDDLRQLVIALPPDELAAFAARLDPDDLSLLEAAAESVTAAGWRSHPAEMASFLDPSFRRPPHVEHLSRKFRQAADGESRRQIWNLPGRYGKPVQVDEPVLMADGSRRRLGDIVAGDRVISGSGRACMVLAVHDQGEIPVVRISTRRGRSVVAAPDHPFLTAGGWRHAGDLRPRGRGRSGDVLGVVRQAVNSPLLPDEVVAVEPAGTAECRCLTVDVDETFTVADLVVHNSTLVQWGGTWLFDRTEGRARLIFVSYGQTLANENADGVRERLRQHAGVLRTQLRRDRQAINRFVTDAGGGLLAAGINASITGFGANALGGIVIDDPFKNWQEAHSETRREHVWNQYRGTIRNRLDEEDGFIIVVHHRVHEDDLTAKLLAEMGKDEFGDEWDLVSLPAIAGDNDPLGRAPGEALDPEIRPIEDVRRRAAGLGSYLASALEQQNPTPEEGTDIKRAWFRIEEAEPPAFDDACTSWDLKLKDKETGDYVVGQAWWRVAGGYWLVDQVRGQYDHATTQNAIALLAVRRPEIKTHVVEMAASADEVITELRRKRSDYVVSDEVASRLGMTVVEREAVQALRRRGMSGIVPKKVGGEGSKRVRARNYVVPNAEAGDVNLVDRPYLPALLDELAAFPNGAHDDQVDAMSQALGRLSTGQASASVPQGTVPRSRPGRSAATARVARGPSVASRRRRT